MNQVMLEEYRCRKCGRVFCIRPQDRSSLDVGFGRPYGCDDNGERVATIGAEGTDAEHTTGIRDHRMVITLCDGDFESPMGRKPRDQEEFDDWAKGPAQRPC